jgi:uncharacterized OB-fold protein
LTDEFTEAFLAAARLGELLVQVCQTCTASNSYATTNVCHRCGSVDLIARRSPGVGSVVSWTEVNRPSDGNGKRTVVLVELDEGVRVLGLTDGTWRVSITDRVAFVHSGDETGALIFRRDGDGHHAPSTRDQVLDIVASL